MRPRAALDLELVAELPVGRIERRPIGRLDAGSRGRCKQLSRVLADDMVPRETPEPLIGAVREDIAAVLDGLGGHAGWHVVQHRFQKLLGGRKLPRQGALLADVEMRRNRAAIRQHEIFRQNGAPVGQLGDQAVRAGGLLVVLVVGHAEHAALTTQPEDVGPGHVGPEIRPRQPIDLEIAVVAEDDPRLRVGHYDALVQIVQRGRDEGIAPELRAPYPSQRRVDPQHDGRQERAHRDAAKQRLPDQIGIEPAQVALRGEIVGQRKGARGRNRAGQACQGLHRRQKRAARVPVLVSHQPPAISTRDCLASRVGIG